MLEVSEDVRNISDKNMDNMSEQNHLITIVKSITDNNTMGNNNYSSTNTTSSVQSILSKVPTLRQTTKNMNNNMNNEKSKKVVKTKLSNNVKWSVKPKGKRPSALSFSQLLEK